MPPCPPAAAPVAAADAGNASASADALERAKDLFRQGTALAKAGDYARALEFFQRSRGVVASVPNTLNAAVSLRQLGRFDEALELFEELLTRFGDKLAEDERTTLAGEMSAARAKVGSVDVQANVEGSLVIDGRQRGKLPLFSPVRVLGGRHVVQVIKDGYASYRGEVTVVLGQTALVDAKLEPLAASGRVRVDAGNLAGASIRVDGAIVATAPWEGALAPGPHLIAFERGDEGSAPKQFTAVLGQTATIESSLAPLGPAQRLLAEPSTAELFIDGVALGVGRWEGRLPVGEHELSALEPGYLAGKLGFEALPATGGDVTVKLAIDDSHARWRASRKGELLFDVWGGPGLAPSLGSGAEASCATLQCTSDPLALGYVVGARVGYELWFGMAIEVVGGYLSAQKTLTRNLSSSFDAGAAEPVATSYELKDELRLTGPLAGFGLGYRRTFGGVLQARADVAVGALFASASDAIDGTVTASGRSEPVLIDGSGAATPGVDLWVMPQLTVGTRFASGVSLGAGLSAAVFLLDGASHAYGDLELVAPNCDGLDDPAAVDCVPGTRQASAEKAYGPLVLWLPTVTMGYAF